MKLLEAFGYAEKNYLFGIAYEKISYDEEGSGNVSTKGYVVKPQEGDLLDIDAYATKFIIGPKAHDDSRASWTSEDPYEDMMTGERTYYTLVVRNLDGSSIGKEDIDAINQKLSEESENGMVINPVPLSVHY
jgi:hypothetical protein